MKILQHRYSKVVLVALCLSCVLSSCDKKRQYTRSGNSDYKDKAFAKANENYEKALKEDSTFSPALFNRGNSFYMASDSNYSAAIDSYSKFLSKPMGKTKKDSLQYADAFYNRGNSLFSLSQANPQDSASNKYLKQAALDYQNSLLLNPQDSNAKYNLALCLWLMKNDNQQQNNQNQQQNQQMLEAIKVNEKKILEKTKKKPQESQKPQNEKDW